MSTITLSRVINRRVAELFAVIANVGSYADWEPPFELELKGFGKQAHEVQDCEQGVRFCSGTRAKGMRSEIERTFAAEGDTTQVDYEFMLRAKGLMRILSPFVGVMSQRMLRKSAAGLQEYCERK